MLGRIDKVFITAKTSSGGTLPCLLHVSLSPSADMPLLTFLGHFLKAAGRWEDCGDWAAADGGAGGAAGGAGGAARE